MSDEIIKTIFDHLRNMLIGSTFLALAVLLTRSGVDSGSIYQFAVGFISITGAFSLLAYNSIHGIKKLHEILPRIYAIIISVIYYPIIIELIRISWSAKIGL
jgi:hypothetical protein